MKYIALSALAFAVLGSAASATTYTLDFDADSDTAVGAATLDSSSTQTITNSRVFTDGFTWEITSGGGLGPALFDTTCPYGADQNSCLQDGDLRVTDQDNAAGVSGNVLIQQRTPGTSASSQLTPNDDAGTQTLTLKLLSDITLEWTGASALDDGFYAFSFGSDELGFVDNGSGRAFDNAFGSVDFADTALIGLNDEITVSFRASASSGLGASGAVDNFRFNIVEPSPVPVPASLPLLLAGAGSLLALRRRKKAA